MLTSMTPGSGRDAEMRQARIGRRLVALQDDRQLHFFGGRLDGGDEFEVVLQRWRSAA